MERDIALLDHLMFETAARPCCPVLLIPTYSKTHVLSDAALLRRAALISQLGRVSCCYCCCNWTQLPAAAYSIRACLALRVISESLAQSAPVIASSKKLSLDQELCQELSCMCRPAAACNDVTRERLQHNAITIWSRFEGAQSPLSLHLLMA